MMRNWFLILLLGNILVALWQYREAPPGNAGRRASGIPTLELYAAPSAGAEPVLPAAASAAPQCVRVGPFMDARTTATARAALVEAGAEVSERSEQGQIWLGHWVQVGGFASLDRAEEARAQLAGGGLADAYIMQVDGEPRISLGVFRERPRADRVAQIARALGFDPLMTDRIRPAIERWLIVRLPADNRVALTDLASNGARILRSESVACE